MEDEFKKKAEVQCPRPTDENGQLYQTEYGEFIRMTVTEGVGFVVIKSPYSASPQGLRITPKVAGKLEKIPTGTQITLFGYIGSSLSGANPPYSCVEF